MNHSVLVPDIDAEIEHIFRTSTVPAGYQYRLTSVNWLFNDRVIDVFNEEYKNCGLSEHVSEYMLILLHVIYAFLALHKCDVVHNRFMQFLDFDAIYKAFSNRSLEVNRNNHQFDPNNIKSIHSMFSKTLQALSTSFRNDDKKELEFIYRNNMLLESESCPSVPVSVHLCPWYYVITFIH